MKFAAHAVDWVALESVLNYAAFVGRPISEFCGDPTVAKWSTERIFDEEIDETSVDYIFAENGVAIRCDLDDTIRVIFLSADENGGFDDSCFVPKFSWSRAEVLERFGTPDKQGEGLSDPVLGEFGPFDRFAYAKVSLHIEYRADRDAIRLITLMHPGSAP